MADHLAGQLRFPWSAFAYILLVALGCVLLLEPTRSSVGMYVAPLTTASVPLVWRFFATTIDMADKSKKSHGDRVDVDADKVKESNKAL